MDPGRSLTPLSRRNDDSNIIAMLDVFRRLLGISKNRKPKGSEEPWKPNRLDAAYGRRKQTLLTLLNALAELSEESSEELGESGTSVLTRPLFCGGGACTTVKG